MDFLYTLPVLKKLTSGEALPNCHVSSMVNWRNREEVFVMSENHNYVDPETGTVIFHRLSEITKGIREMDCADP